MSPSPAAYDPFCLALIFLVPLVLAGFSLMNTGLGRTRSAAHFMLASLATIAVAACVYCLWGFSLEGFAGRAAHVIMLGGKPWDWIATQSALVHGLPSDGSAAASAAFLQVFAVALAALIPLAAGADRWRLNAGLLSTVLLAGWIYPLFAHWVWGGGWLSQLGSNYGLGDGFLDAGGASTIHVVGGVSALAMVWVLGPRLGKYSTGGAPAAIPGHNVIYVLFGCALMLPGWMALNAAGAILFVHVAPAQTVLVAVNTVLSASAACLGTMATTRMRFTKPDASLCANGWVAGLVASSAVSPFVTPLAAILIGLVAGIAVTLSIEILEMRLGLDDPGGAISAHGLAGIWGLLAMGLFGHPPNQGTGEALAAVHPQGQLLAQVIGLATLIGFVLPMTYGLNWALNRIYPQRVPSRGEQLGMDLNELGGGAYPEFVIRTDEFGK